MTKEQIHLQEFFIGLTKFDRNYLENRFADLTKNCDLEFTKFQSYNVLTKRTSNLSYPSAKKLCLPQTPKKTIAFNVLWAYFNNKEPRITYPLYPIDNIDIMLVKEQLSTWKELTASIDESTIKFTYQRIANDIRDKLVTKYRGILDFTDFLKDLQSGIREYVEKNYTKLQSGMLVNTEFLKKYEKCKEYLLENRDRIHIYHGPAGTGKSYLVRQQATPNSTVITSLSNTIAIANQQKIPGSSFLSKSKLSYINNKNRDYSTYCGNDTVIFDEFSQWDCLDLELVIKLMKMNPYAQVFFMGDLNQIHTFIANGSLLYEFVDVLKLPSVKLDVLRRFESANDKLAMNNLIESLKPEGDEPIRITCSTSYNISKYDVAVCFTNDTVLKLNKEMLTSKFGYKEGYKITNNEQLLKDLSRQHIVNYFVFATTTRKYGEFKVYSNQQFKVLAYEMNYSRKSYKEPTFYVRLSDCEGNVFKIPDCTFFWNFAPAYAITADKAQGLEWSNVLIYLPNTRGNLPQNLDEKRLYVSLSRYQASCIVYFDDEYVTINRSGIKYKPLVQY